jgi:hypothetical protein
MESGDVLLRVERGNPDDTELAALAAVLGLLWTADREAHEGSQPGPRWWRRGDAYAAPGSWR